MPSKPMMRMVTATHEFWYRLTGGFIGGRFGKAPILLLTTKGAKTGKSRTMPLLYYPDGENLVLIASFGGSDHHPGWYVNLRKNPKVEVHVGRETKTLTAETANAEEKARLWPLVVNMYSQYADYQTRTKRDIPVVVLKPE
jgi:deazaflavin-dependent oxidoreductase (nitroreductase family)